MERYGRDFENQHSPTWQHYDFVVVMDRLGIKHLVKILPGQIIVPLCQVSPVCSFMTPTGVEQVVETFASKNFCLVQLFAAICRGQF